MITRESRTIEKRDKIRVIKTDVDKYRECICMYEVREESLSFVRCQEIALFSLWFIERYKVVSST